MIRIKLLKYFSSTINQVDRQNFNKIQDWWSVGGSMAPLYSYNHLRVQFIHEILQRPQKGKSLTGLHSLDVGVGGGILSESLRRLGSKVTGIDVSENSIETAIQHKNTDPELRNDQELQYKLISIEELSKQQEMQFDIITAMEVIEHVENLPLFIESLGKLLKPDGKLFISSINKSYESYMKLIIGAEYIARVVPKGTHDWNNFKTPEQVWLQLNKQQINIDVLRGVEYNLWSGEMKYSNNETQYIMACSKQKRE
ncbi:unnamed protein product [Paramecium pentaurelia]|uniref:Ubiquinone biosynthesis O-methyltransferase, mitochondrial n=1 Tax=Paramecium pentaurelia TaxID=43138 RepID=A0A8S1SIZ2_9CILI|nr:unnamed protein product [Paramecium pentaurelia]